MKRLGVICILLVAAVVGSAVFWHATGVHEVRVEDNRAALSLAAAQPAWDDHPWWRGLSRNGLAAGDGYPFEWSASDNALWKSPIAGQGHASPCLCGQQVFIFTADADSQTHLLLALNRHDGREAWRCEVNEGGFPEIHAKNSHASATPACDGEHVFVTFVAHGQLWMAAVDLRGNLAWKTAAGAYQSKHGFGSSPALYNALVIVAGDNKGARIDRLVGSSFLAALHRQTGEIVWRIKRPAVDSYGTPIVAHIAGKDQLLLSGHGSVDSYDPATGESIWHCDWPADSTAQTVAFDDEHGFVSTTEPHSQVICIRADGRGDVTDSHIAWESDRSAAYVPSLLVARGRLYMLSDNGVLSCLDAASGEELWTKRLGGNFSASPVVSKDGIYLTSEDGKTHVLSASDECEVLARCEVPDAVLATPALCGGQIFIRGREALWCLGDGRATIAAGSNDPRGPTRR